MRYRQRVARLEEYRRKRRPPSHFLSVVCTPWQMDGGAIDHWHREELACACGQVGCPELRVGALLPEKAPSVEAWAERAQAYDALRGNHA
jgi:hypothetical protein